MQVIPCSSVLDYVDDNLRRSGCVRPLLILCCFVTVLFANLAKNPLYSLSVVLETLKGSVINGNRAPNLARGHGAGCVYVSLYGVGAATYFTTTNSAEGECA